MLRLVNDAAMVAVGRSDTGLAAVRGEGKGKAIAKGTPRIDDSRARVTLGT